MYNANDYDCVNLAHFRHGVSNFEYTLETADEPIDVCLFAVHRDKLERIGSLTKMQAPGPNHVRWIKLEQPRSLGLLVHYERLV
jgi:hypothetical protein